MAKLTFYLADRIVAHRLTGRRLEDIDLTLERATLSGADAVDRIEQTAAELAAGVWFQVYDRLQAEYPLIELPNERVWPPELPGRPPRRRQPGTITNHFVPRFTTRPWADANGEVRVLTRQPDGSITAIARPFSTWGFERFLYPAQLEEWFQRVESRAAAPYRSIVAISPLSPDDLYFWISFLILQQVRTPSFMAMLARGLRQRAVSEEWPWSMTPELLRRTYATLFDDDRVFTSLYRRIDGRRWTVLVAPPGMTFPRCDCPVAPSRPQGGGWRCYYPLSPGRCFVAGPIRATPEDVPAALSETLSPAAMSRLNAFLLRSSRRSFVVHTGDSVDGWRALAASHLSLVDPVGAYSAWGGMHI